MFSKRFSNSISLTTVTPSLVTVGAPKLRWIITLRPLGPKVTRAASATSAAPATIPALALSCSSTVLAGMYVDLHLVNLVQNATGQTAPPHAGSRKVTISDDVHHSQPRHRSQSLDAAPLLQMTCSTSSVAPSVV